MQTALKYHITMVVNRHYDPFLNHSSTSETDCERSNCSRTKITIRNITDVNQCFTPTLIRI